MRYLIGILVTIGLVVVILVLLFRGGSTPSTVSKVIRVDTYANSSSAVAEVIVDGPIIANQKHNQFKIDISQASVDMTTYQGYDQQVIQSQSYPNNPQSFAVFMHALQHAGFALGNKDPTFRDERGYCPSNERFIFSLSDNGSKLYRFWATSCGQGTFKGNQETVGYLFRQQVPDYTALTRSLNVSY